MKTKRNFFLTGLLWAAAMFWLAASAHAADGSPVWTNNFYNGIYPSGQPVVDGSGNVYVAGYANNSGGNSDYVTLKYSSAGIPLWTNFFNGAANGYDTPSAMAVDTNGNVYVTGGSDGGTNNSDYATIKYSGAGLALWTNYFNSAGNGSDFAMALAVDGSGNVYVAGASSTNSSAYDYVTIKYSSAGLPLWTNRVYATYRGDELAVTVAVDGSGNAYVTGGKYDYVTIKYSGASGFALVINTGSNFGFAGKQFRFSVTGPAGSNAVISASTNLQTWMPLVTNLLPLGVLTYTDALATNFTRRFYRATLQP